MAVSIERYLTVCLGYRPPSVPHRFYTVPILGLTLLFNVSRFLELRTGHAERNVTIVVDQETGEVENVTRRVALHVLLY